jgi:6,7-dimethyl-8-ribityllumazine synthase
MSEDAPIFELSEEVIADLCFGIVAARYNKELVDSLIDQVITTLQGAGVPNDNIRLIRVPGSHEIPYTVNMLAMSGEADCIIALGVVIAGETDHHDVIAVSTATALQNISIELEIPIINGIITTKNKSQAEDRVNGSHKRGVQYANAALEMAAHAESFWQEKMEIDFDDNI